MPVAVEDRAAAIHARGRALLERAAELGMDQTRVAVAGPAITGLRPDLRFTWAEQSDERGDIFPLESAIATSLLEAFDVATDTKVGYLKISFTTAELVAERYPTLLHFAKEHGWCLNLDGDPRQLWADVHRYARTCPTSLRAAGEHIGSWQLTAAHAPELSTVRDADIADATAEWAERFADWVPFYLNPFVAYSRAEVPRAGIGTALYEVGARMLAARGKALRASGSQSNDAIGLWQSLAAGPLATPEITLTYGHEARTYLSIDLR